ncbi:SDR family oxidoreductase [Mucilaginibacter sp. 22184]|uniref:SDR family oxidoreductase n=1 Tax=Mucilaginibacter sp. 22184 TaxID=3453887 RepID=UPI003F8761BB
MNISNKTVLITGGGSGIGHETAKLLSEKGNKVLIIGRNGEKLEKAAEGLANVRTYQADITKGEDVTKLVSKIKAEFGDLSILINNAAAANVYKHSTESLSFDKASEEIQTNYLAVIRLNEVLLPVLKAQPESAIVNVTSLVAFAPVTVIPTYSDSKAALHSYSLTLRHTLAVDTTVKVFELMPPLVNTEFSKDIGGEANGMPSSEVAQALIDGLENDVYEIHVGQTADFRSFFLSNPHEAFNTLNQA